MAIRCSLLTVTVDDLQIQSLHKAPTGNQRTATHNERILVTFCGLKAFLRADAWTKRLQALPMGWAGLRESQKSSLCGWEGDSTVTKGDRDFQYCRQKLTENYWRTERNSLFLQRKKSLFWQKMIRVKERADTTDSARIHGILFLGQSVQGMNWISREILQRWARDFKALF